MDQCLHKDQSHAGTQHQQSNSLNGTDSKANIKLSWTEGKEVPDNIPIGALCDAVVSDDVVCFKDGGNVWAYNYINNTWSRLATPFVGGQNCGGFFLAMVKNNLTALGGGRQGHETNQTLSLIGEGSHKEWTEVLPPMPTKRKYATAIGIGAYLIIAGGEVGGKCLTTVEVLNTDTMQWSTAADLPSPLAHSSATICGDHIFMLGGYNTSIYKISRPADYMVLTCSLSALLQSCHSGSLGSELNASPPKNPQSTVWSRVADLPVRRSTCVTLHDRLLAIGGEDSDNKHTSAVRMYDTTTNSWEVISRLKTPKTECYAAVLPGNKLVVVGGRVRPFSSTNTVEIASVV